MKANRIGMRIIYAFMTIGSIYLIVVNKHPEGTGFLVALLIISLSGFILTFTNIFHEN